MSCDTNESVPHSFVFEFASKEEYLEFVKNFPSGSFDNPTVKTYDLPGSVERDYISLGQVDKVIASIVESREQQYAAKLEAYEARCNLVSAIVALGSGSSSDDEDDEASCDDQQASVVVDPPAPPTTVSAAASAAIEAKRLALNAEISAELFAEAQSALLEQMTETRASLKPPCAPVLSDCGGGGKVLPSRVHNPPPFGGGRLANRRVNVPVTTTTPTKQAVKPEPLPFKPVVVVVENPKPLFPLPQRPRAVFVPPTTQAQRPRAVFVPPTQAQRPQVSRPLVKGVPLSPQKDK